MARWCVINYSDIEPHRADAEFFDSYYQSILQTIKKSGNIEEFKYLFNHIGRGEKPEYSEKGTVPVVRSVNVENLSFNDIRQDYVTENFCEVKDRGKIFKDDIVITSTGTGTLGRASIWYHKKTAFNVPENTVLRGRKAVDPYLIAIFLNTKFGKSQFFQHQRGSSGQLHLYPNDIKKMIFPLILLKKENELSQMIKKSFELNQQAISLFSEPHNLIDKELKLNMLKFKKPVGYEANFSQAMFSSRTDAEHFYPEFDNLCRRLPGHINFTPLSKALVYCQRGKQPEYSENGIRVINSKHVSSNKINFEDTRFAEEPPLDALKINHGDVLMNGTGRGTIGRAAPYFETDPALPDNHVTILRTQGLDPVFLSVFLNSKAGQLQVEKHQRGSSGQIELYPQDIRKFLIWEAPQSLQAEIRDLHDQALSLEKESKQLLEQAKQMVEDLIEQAAGKT